MFDLTGCDMCYGDIPTHMSHMCMECGITTCDGCMCPCYLNGQPLSQKEVVMAELNRRIDFLEKRKQEYIEYEQWGSIVNCERRTEEVKELMRTFHKILK